MVLPKETHNSLDQSLFNLLPKDKEFVVVTHTLQIGETIKTHYHPNTTEWIILPKGQVEISADNVSEDVEVPEGVFVTVTILPTVKHGLVAKTPVDYFVVRNKNSDIIYVK
jgi:quercetin dioxygenase-like cupin family protein